MTIMILMKVRAYRVSRVHTRAEPPKAHVDTKSLEGMRKFSEQYARR